MSKFDLHLGNCLDVLKGFPAESVDAIVTDPPYGLSFMAKKWDYDVPGTEIWAECLRVLKPEGNLLCFAGTRTQHRMVARVVEAGFTMQDAVLWAYGSGFPKSHNISKAIDKELLKKTPPGFSEWLKAERESKGLTAKELCEIGKFYKNVNHGGLVSNWEAGIGSPDVEQFNLLCDILDLPFEKRNKVQVEILGWRKVVPGVAFSSEGPSELPVTPSITDAAKQWEGWHTALKPSFEPVSIYTKGGSLTLYNEFKRLYYCAKASKRERNMGLKDKVSDHPTVKPLKLMESLCELATPKGGVILDPFMGSGTTGIAALNFGFDFIGIEMGEDYFDIAQTRIVSLHGDPQQ